MTRIVEAGIQDLDTVVPLFDAYRQFYGQRSDPVGSRRFLEDRIRRNESRLFLAREHDGTPLGFVQLYPSFSSVAMRRLWILNDLFVHPGSRRRGVGEALLQHCVMFARHSGAIGLVLETGSENIPAQRLYDRCGWTREKEFITYRFRLEE